MTSSRFLASSTARGSVPAPENTSAWPLAFAALTERWINSSEVGQSSPMPRCAVSIASATPRPRSQTCSRNAMVLSQSIAADSHGSQSASASETKCAAENATRFSVPSSFDGNVREAARRKVSIERSVFGSFSDSDETGKTGLFMAATSSQLDRSDFDPALFAPALQRAFRELHTLGAFQQRVLVGRIFADVADEHFPLLLKAVVVRAVLRDLLPVGVKIVGTFLVGIPHRPRRRLAGLNDAVGKPGYRRAVGAVDLEGDEIVAIDPRHPGHVDMRDDAALEPEGRIGGIISRRLV